MISGNMKKKKKEKSGTDFRRKRKVFLN